MLLPILIYDFTGEITMLLWQPFLQCQNGVHVWKFYRASLVTHDVNNINNKPNDMLVESENNFTRVLSKVK